MELLTVKDAASILKIDPWTLRKYLRNGTIPGYRIDAGWRIAREDLQKYLDSRANGRRNAQNNITASA